MALIFKYATPIIYTLLILVWAFIFLFYIKKIRQIKPPSKLVRLLLIVLCIDAFRTLFESVYFGAWFSSFSELIPISIYNFLAQAHLVFIPKLVNFISAFLILFILLKRWFPAEIIQQEQTEQQIKQQTQELLFNNKALEQALEQAEKNEVKYKSLFNSIPDAVLVANTKRVIINCNPSFSNIFGYTSNEVIGKQTAFCYQNKAQFIKLGDEIKKHKNDNTNFSYTVNYKRKNNTIFPGETSIYYIHNAQNEITSFVGLIRDVSEREEHERQITIKTKKLEIAKEKAEESNQLKTEFINNMSHEIRTPMNGILGFSELLSQPDLSEQRKKNYINIIENCGNQLVSVIDDILEISILGTKQVKVSDKEICLNELLIELFLLFDIKANEKKISLYLKKTLPDTSSIIYTDQVRLSKIMTILLSNAVKYTIDGYIEFGYNISETSDSIELFVKDTGIGIKKEMHQSIFGRFSQVEKQLSKKTGGLGLGLAIAKENAKLLGSKIFMKSEIGKGSTFSIQLPFKKPILPNKKKTTQNEEQNQAKKFTFLIAEDEEINYLYLETLLHDQLKINCLILHAKQGNDAVELCKEHPEINIILMDLKMPIMNGFSATEKIKSILPNIPIIAQTAYSTADDREKALAAGCDDYITKPISEEMLNLVLHKFLVFT